MTNLLSHITQPCGFCFLSSIFCPSSVKNKLVEPHHATLRFLFFVIHFLSVVRKKTKLAIFGIEPGTKISLAIVASLHHLPTTYWRGHKYCITSYLQARYVSCRVSFNWRTKKLECKAYVRTAEELNTFGVSPYYGVVHTWVGQKLLNCYIFKSFYDRSLLANFHISA